MFTILELTPATLGLALALSSASIPIPCRHGAFECATESPPEGESGAEDDSLSPLSLRMTAVLGVSGAKDAQLELIGSLVEASNAGSAPAAAMTVELLEDPRCSLHGDGLGTMHALRSLRATEQIARFARRAIEDALSRGAQQTMDLVGYQFLLARNGGLEARLTIQEYLVSSCPGLRGSAAAAVAELDPRGASEDFLRLLAAERTPETGGPLAASMARWRAPETDRQLLTLVSSPGLSPGRRAAILRSLGPYLDDEGLRRYVSLYATTSARRIRLAVLEGLRYVQPGPRLDGEGIREVLETFVRARLDEAAEDARIAASACRLIEELPALGVWPLHRRLQRLLPELRAGPLRDAVRAALDGMRP